MIRQLSLTPSVEEEMGRIDYTTFVSIDSQEFRRILEEFSDYRFGNIYVTSTLLLFNFMLLDTKW